MNRERAARIERVLAGVVRQASADAGDALLMVSGNGPDAALAGSICEQAVGRERLGDGGLIVDTASKTALLLGACSNADVLLFGDLYYSQVVELAGAVTLPPAVARLAESCGGAQVLDRVLSRFFDERAEWPKAADELPGFAREQLAVALESGRFRRARLGIVPKLTARTLGVDLFA
jgi:hypothetical protein